MTTNVLVFESDPEFAAVLKAGLLAYGCQTTVVDDGEAGISLASDNPPDLILLTIELPRMNGFSVCNKLKRNGNLKKVPLVLLSSEATDETFDQHKRLRTRADEYVHKPVTVDQLVQKLAGVISLSKSAGDAGAGSLDADSMGADSAGAEVEDLEEVAFDEDVEIEEVQDDVEAEEVGAVEEETEEAFGNLIAPEPAPAADAVEMEDLELDEDDGLKVAPPVERPASLPPPSPVSSGVGSGGAGSAAVAAENEQLAAENAALKGEVASLQSELTSAREATVAESDAKAQVTQKKDGEIALLEEEVALLKKKLESSEGAGTAREFLDLREQLNKKDKEILDIRDQLNSKEKEVVRLKDDNIALGRQNADAADRTQALEKELSVVRKERDSALADKEQAQKRGDDFKSKTEKLQGELEAKVAELARSLESHENTMAKRDAQEAAMRDDHATALKDAAASAAQALSKAVAEAIAQTEERAAGEKEAALVLAAEESGRARLEAVSAREAELKAEHDSKLAALHRANEESLRKLRAEHDHSSEQAAQAAAQRLADREAELLREKEAALAEQKATDEARLAEVDAQRARLKADLDTRTSERDANLAIISEREKKIEELETAVASQRIEVVQLGDKLAAESALLSRAREKWSQDEAALKNAKEALEKVSADVEAALLRSMP